MSVSMSRVSQANSSDAVLVDLFEEIAAKVQAGEPVDPDAYVEEHPEQAEQLRRLLPAIHVLADLGRSAAKCDPSVASVAAPVELERGVLGDFRIFGEIGRGGMGIVYAAEQVSLGRRVALKVLPFAAAMDVKQLQRFKNEAQAAAHLHHQNIVPVYAVGCERGVHYYAMQYIEGQPVAALIRELRQLAGLEAADPSGSAAPANALASELVSGRWAPARKQGGEVVRSCAGANATGPYQPHSPLPHHLTTSPPDHPTTAPAPDATPPVGALSTERSASSPAFFRTVAHLGVEAAEALEHAHAKGIIHRDIKPANMLLDAGGNLWITDFGLARMLSEVGLTMTGDLLGTLRYMSPEQALAKRAPVDHRSDVYSLGVTLYELLTLRPAYDGRDRQEVMQQIAFEEPRLPRRLNKAIPAELETIVRKAIAKNPAERYATAQELADDLRRFLDDKPIRAKRPTIVDWTRKWARRHQGVVTTGIGGLIVAVGILAVSTLMILSAYKTEANLRAEAEKERQAAVNSLYRSLVGEATTIRRARGDGYRVEAWKRLQHALQLETADKDAEKLRHEAVACMGDSVGLGPSDWTDFPADIRTIALHPNGAELALGLEDGTVLLRDLAGAHLDRLRQHPCQVNALAYAPDGKRLISMDSQGTIQVWAANANAKWVPERTMSSEPAVCGYIPSVAFPYFVPFFDLPMSASMAVSPDGKRLAAAHSHRYSSSRTALWNLADGTRTATFYRGRGFEQNHSVAFSPDGKSLAASSWRNDAPGVLDKSSPAALYQHAIMLWDLDSLRVQQDVSVDGLSFVYPVVYSPDGKFLACSCEGGVVVFDTSNFQRHIFMSGEGYYGWRPAAFSPDSRLLAIGTCSQKIKLWDISNNRQVAVLNHPGWVHSVAFSKDGKSLVAASDRAVRKWNLAGNGEKLILSGHGQGLPGVAFSPDGKFLASAGKDSKVKIWNPRTGQLLKEIPGFGYEVQAVAFSPDGSMLATGDYASTIKIWDVRTWKLLASPEHDSGWFIRSVAFSPDGRFLAACGAGCEFARPKGGVTIWRLIDDGANPEGLCLQRISGPPNPGDVSSLAFGPDSAILAWVRDDNTLHLWDLLKSREPSFPPVHLTGHDSSIAFLRDGKHLIFVADKGVAEVWDFTTGQKALSFGEGKHGVDGGAILGYTIAVSMDGSWLASCHGSMVSIWDTQSRKCLLVLPEEQSTIWIMAWSPDQKQLAVGSADGGLVLWNLPKIKAQLDQIGLGW